MGAPPEQRESGWHYRYAKVAGFEERSRHVVSRGKSRRLLSAIRARAPLPNSAECVAQIIETRRRTFELVELEQRIAALEKTRDTER